MWTVSSSHFITSVKAQRAGADSSPAALVTRFISLLMSQPTFQEHWTKTSEFPGATYLECLTDTCKSSHWHQRENHINWCHCRGLSSAPVLKSVNSMTPHRYVSLKNIIQLQTFVFRWRDEPRLTGWESAGKAVWQRLACIEMFVLILGRSNELCSFKTLFRL